MKTLSDHNKAVADARVDASNAIAARAELYDADKTGLKIAIPTSQSRRRQPVRPP